MRSKKNKEKAAFRRRGLLDNSPAQKKSMNHANQIIFQNSRNTTTSATRYPTFGIDCHDSRIRCIYCGSDYMRHAVNGYCQSCQQRVEFINRERRASMGGVR